MIKDKKCKVCDKIFTPNNSIQKVCSVNCAIEFAKKETIRNFRTVEKQEQRNWKEKKKELKEKIKTISDYKNELQKDINKIVRLLDKGHECISSGRYISANGQAGHCFSRGAFPSIRFNLHNIWLQSVHDNLHLSGNLNGFRTRLIEKFGHGYFDYLESLKGISINLTKEEIVECRAICKEIIKELEKSEYLTDEERLNKRYELNKRIGIYEK